MRILLIDNGTTHRDELVLALAGQDIRVQSYDNPINANDSDCVILSGSKSHTVLFEQNEFVHERAFIQQATVPVLGICLGHQLISHVHGSSLARLEAREKGIIAVHVVATDQLTEGVQSFGAYEHWWTVRTPGSLTVLAKSKDGIEMVRHPEKLMYGMQLHPEVFVEKNEGHQFIGRFLKLAQKHISLL